MRPLADSHIHFCSIPRYGEFEIYLRSLSVRRAGLISLPDPVHGNFNPEILFAKWKLPDAVFLFGELDYAEGSPPLADQIRDLFRAGFDGVKLIMGKPAFAKKFGRSLSDPEFSAVFEAAADLGLPVLTHVGDPVYFWDSRSEVPWTYGEDDPSFESCIRLAEELVSRHPRTVIIFPHLLFLAHDLPRLETILLGRPGVYVDLAPGKYFYRDLSERRTEAEGFFRRCRERVLFGSDGFYFGPDYRELEYTDLFGNIGNTTRLLTFLESDLPFPNPFRPTFGRAPVVTGLALGDGEEGEDILEMVRWTNFRTLMGERPRPVDPRAVLAYLRDFTSRRLLGGGRGDGVENFTAELERAE
jgi:predicted TIM-barrel fold metal-dependent hydrolase